MTDCVVDARSDEVAIWHVHTGFDTGMPRLTGAWVLAVREVAKIDLLVRGRRVLATAAGEKALRRLGVRVEAHIDPDATLKGFAALCEELQAVYEALEKKPKQPSWPTLPQPLDMAALDRAGLGAEPALTVARWLERMAIVWDEIEGERSTRKYLPHGRERRPVALAVRGAA
ncbi:hypothetical protein GCM10022247_28430 [Allokutzneria multivorans]|uniref:Uncharacterized protein n=1 Tax=Allokutzneria multivorans TaxID=1142134 RepID=A0ABP7S1L4_9PSEU